MTIRYAETTTVSVQKTKGEIDDLLHRQGAERIGVASEDGRAVVWFEVSKRRVQFNLKLPRVDDFATFKDYRGYTKKRTPEKQRAEWEQACRSQWRALFLTIKAKFVSLESQVETLEEAFLAQLQVPGVRGSFAEWAIPQIVKAYEEGPGLPLLPSAGAVGHGG